MFKLERAQAALAVPHLQMRALGAPAAVMLFALNGAYRGLTDTRCWPCATGPTHAVLGPCQP